MSVRIPDQPILAMLPDDLTESARTSTAPHAVDDTAPGENYESTDAAETTNLMEQQEDFTALDDTAAAPQTTDFHQSDGNEGSDSAEVVESAPGAESPVSAGFTVMYKDREINLYQLLDLDPATTIDQLANTDWWDQPLETLSLYLKLALSLEERDLVYEFPQLDFVIHDDSSHINNISLSQLWRAYRSLLTTDTGDAPPGPLQIQLRDTPSTAAMVLYLHSVLGEDSISSAPEEEDDDDDEEVAEVLVDAENTTGEKTDDVHLISDDDGLEVTLQAHGGDFEDESMDMDELTDDFDAYDSREPSEHSYHEENNATTEEHYGPILIDDESFDFAGASAAFPADGVVNHAGNVGQGDEYNSEPTDSLPDNSATELDTAQHIALDLDQIAELHKGPDSTAEEVLANAQAPDHGEERWAETQDLTATATSQPTATSGTAAVISHHLSKPDLAEDDNLSLISFDEDDDRLSAAKTTDPLPMIQDQVDTQTLAAPETLPEAAGSVLTSTSPPTVSEPQGLSTIVFHESEDILDAANDAHSIKRTHDSVDLGNDETEATEADMADFDSPASRKRSRSPRSADDRSDRSRSRRRLPSPNREFRPDPSRSPSRSAGRSRRHARSGSGGHSPYGSRSASRRREDSRDRYHRRSRHHRSDREASSRDHSYRERDHERDSHRRHRRSHHREPVVPLDERPRQTSSHWDEPPQGYENMSVAEAKASNKFILPFQRISLEPPPSSSSGRPRGRGGPHDDYGSGGGYGEGRTPRQYDKFGTSVNATALGAPMLDPAQREQAMIDRKKRTVYVGNLPMSANQRNLGDFFTTLMRQFDQFGPAGAQVNDVHIHKSRAFAFIEFGKAEEAMAALTLDGIVFDNVPLKIGPPKIPNGRDERAPEFKGTTGAISNMVDDGPNKLFLGSLPYYVQDNQLIELLETFGKLKSFHLVKGATPGLSKGFGFCEYADPEMTDRACEALNGMELGDKHIVVQRASLGTRRGAGGPPPGGFRDGGDHHGLPPPPPMSHHSAFDHRSNEEMPLPRPPPLRSMSGSHHYGQSDRASTTALPLNLSRCVTTDAPAMQPSNVVQLLNMVTKEELVDPDEYEDIKDDIHSECSKYGTITDIRIPRPEPDVEVPGVEKVSNLACG
ncbi:hypothetical protein H4R34_001700 [Dimargaris verticillata]|uniref:RRM domain-containing protein n=1 Tax=Dimargaris verticillata TaxID=2761393 RepID=A0A9W8EDJ5_9FUNG|nr:hypothetical protein H4R34_001700 [Dimargaris verticillata]